MTDDVIDRLIGIEEGDALFALRSSRPDARANAQASFEALLLPDDVEHASRLERLAVAWWTVALSQSATAPFYADLLAAESPETLHALEAALPEAVTTGPYGDYPDGPLTVEDVAGPHWTPSPQLTAVVGGRLAAALAHTHLLTYRPRDSSGAALQALLDAGWDATGVVTLSQLVSFLHFQLRVVAGLTVLKGSLR
jgi:CMD domain protein